MAGAAASSASANAPSVTKLAENQDDFRKGCVGAESCRGGKVLPRESDSVTLSGYVGAMVRRCEIASPTSEQARLSARLRADFEAQHRTVSRLKRDDTAMSVRFFSGKRDRCCWKNSKRTSNILCPFLTIGGHMQLTLCGQSALRQIRAIRYTSSSPTRIVRCDLLDPDPFPRKRWNWNLMGKLEFPAAISCGTTSSGVGDMKTGGRIPSGMLLNVAVPRKAERVRLGGVRNTIYSTALPRGAYIQVGHRLAVSSPELLFIELARELPLPELVMVGFECCGGFSLDPDSPGCGNAKMKVPSQSRVARLMRFACSASRIRGARRALHALKFVVDDAWSPMEAVIGTMLMLPIEEGGYGLGPCQLNRRFETPDELRAAAARSSRVPDILISGSGVGFN